MVDIPRNEFIRSGAANAAPLLGMIPPGNCFCFGWGGNVGGATCACTCCCRFKKLIWLPTIFATELAPDETDDCRRLLLYALTSQVLLPIVELCCNCGCCCCWVPILKFGKVDCCGSGAGIDMDCWCCCCCELDRLINDPIEVFDSSWNWFLCCCWSDMVNCSIRASISISKRRTRSSVCSIISEICCSKFDTWSRNNRISRDWSIGVVVPPPRVERWIFFNKSHLPRLKFSLKNVTYLDVLTSKSLFRIGLDCILRKP